MQFEFGSVTINVTVPDWETLTCEVAHRLENNIGFSMATLNLDHLVKLRKDKEFRDAYTRQDLVTADGNPIVWMSQLARKPVKLIPGSDTIMPLVRIAAAVGVPVALLGSTDETLEIAALKMEKEIDGLVVIRKIAPPMGFDPEGELAKTYIRDVEASGAKLCVLGLGSPKQELMAAQARLIAPNVGFICTGAGLDFIAGSQVRAPRWVRRLALEWLWPALSSPRRLGPRYAKCMAVLPGQMMRALGQRWSRA